MARDTAPRERELVPTGVASRRTGLHRSTLARWVKHGLVQEGREYRDGLTTRSPRRWDLEALESRIAHLRQNPPRPEAED